MLNKKLNSTKVNNRLLQKTEETTLSRRQVKMMTEAMLDNQAFIATLVKILEMDNIKRWMPNGRKKIEDENFLRVRTVPAHGPQRQMINLRRNARINKQTKRRTSRCEKNESLDYHHGTISWLIAS